MNLRVPFESYPFPIKEGSIPFKHQIETTKFLICNKRAYVLNQMGTGKTLSALWAADFLLINNVIDRVLIACPLSTMRAAWGRDILFNLPHRRFAIAHGSRELRTKLIKCTAEIVIINHDGVKIMENELKTSSFDLFIIDELTKFKNFNTDRTKAAHRVAARMKGVWGMTGAPTPNGPIEAFGQAKVVNPSNPFLPTYFGAYRNMVEEKVNMFVSIPKAGANDLVHKILQPAIRYTREECLDLPPCMNDVMFIELTLEQKKAYETMRKQLLIEYEGGSITAVNAGVKLTKLLQIAAGSVKNDEGQIVSFDCSTRMAALMDIYEATPQQKLVMFGAFRAHIEAIHQFFNKNDVSCEIIYGSVGYKERSRIIENFQDGSLHSVIIQPQAASHGITLTAANTVAWPSLVASNEDYSQANDRIVRIGQTRNQYLINIVGCPAEQHLLNLLVGKQANADNLHARFMDFLEPLGS